MQNLNRKGQKVKCLPLNNKDKIQNYCYFWEEQEDEIGEEYSRTLKYWDYSISQ